MTSPLTFTEEDIAVLRQAHEILSDRLDDAQYLSLAYHVLNPLVESLEDAINEITFRGKYSLDNSI